MSDTYQDALASLMALADEDTAPTTAEPEGWPDDEPDTEEEPELYFGSVEEFVREIVVPVYRRKVGPRGSRRWAADWWRSAEAVSRLEALWRSWEHLRQDGATGMSTWWRDHADYHMNALFDPEGPFGLSEDENKAGDPLPYAPPPHGLFPDARQH